MSIVDPKSFDQYLSDAGIKINLKTWLALHPGLKDQLDRHILKGASPSLLFEWLVKEHEYPLERTSIVRYATVLKANT